MNGNSNQQMPNRTFGSPERYVQMNKRICIFANIDYHKEVPKGAVETCNYSIIDDFVRKGYEPDVFRIPNNPSKIIRLIDNANLMFRMLISYLIYEIVVLIYPTIPFAPTTSRMKFHFSLQVYRVFLNNISRYKRTLLLYILDYPSEQDEGLNISHVRIEPGFLDRFESELISKADYIVTFSDLFTKLTEMKQRNSRIKRILQMEFSPIKRFSTKRLSEFEKEIIRYIGQYRCAIFYSGELSREYEKRKLIEIFPKLDNDTAMILCGGNGEWITDGFPSKNIRYIGYINSESHDAIAEKCSYGVILYPNRGYYRLTPTSKLTTYINAHLPVLAIETDTNSPIFKNNDIGECVKEEKIVERLCEWCKDETYSKYKDGVITTSRKIDSAVYFNQISELLRRN